MFIEDFNREFIYWYQQKLDYCIEYLIVIVLIIFVLGFLGGENNKFEVGENFYIFILILKINFLEKEDEVMYYCVCWIGIYSIKVIKIIYIRIIFRFVFIYIFFNIGYYLDCIFECLVRVFGFVEFFGFFRKIFQILFVQWVLYKINNYDLN